jgi:Ca2+-binding EF-hand superfamily protein
MKLKNYRGVSALKKACLNMLVKMLDPKEIEILRKQFMKIDKDGSGTISV